MRMDQKDTIWMVEFGRSDYGEIWEFQKRLVEAKSTGILNTDVLLVGEHDPVFTLGRSRRREHLLVSEGFLRSYNMEVVATERGGEITYHGPGQLMGYPVVDLRRKGLEPVDLVFILEELMLMVCQDFGVKAKRREANRGIWFDGEKLGSIGIAVQRGISFHGFALNVSLDLVPFSWINPCGMRGIGVTSLQKVLSKRIAMEDAVASVFYHAKQLFRAEAIPVGLRTLREYLDHNLGMSELQDVQG